jgi:site-specific DNA-methyltransferase (adenine-specific)
MSQAAFSVRSHNPDVLTCIANLSNDEVFTPPEFANQLLDSLQEAWGKENSGENIWTNKNLKFLDPCTKSGVFLREIVKRLTAGLIKEFPDLNERVNHILTRQVYGIGLTELTSLLARRSVYCSKYANGIHSVARSFESREGNIWFERIEHIWQGVRCKFCSANRSEYERSIEMETHAYAFIHSENIKNDLPSMFGEEMHFDVIIGNPPYQLSDGGGEGASAMPLYHRFVSQAKQLDPRYLVMVIPARWYSGGKGLDEFRSEMLNDPMLSEIHDYPETGMVFPGVNIRGGICYFLRSKAHVGDSKIVNYKKNSDPLTSYRPLLEPGLTSFVRYNEAIPILTKVRNKKEETFDSRVQSRNPYGIPSDFSDFSNTKSAKTPVILFRSRRGASTDKEVYVAEKHILNNASFKDKIKVLVSKASPGGDEYPHSVLGRPFVAPKNSVSTETYLIIDFPKTVVQAKNLVSYMETRFFRFLVSLIKNTQNISKASFAFVPIQDFSEPWTDEMLYKKYNISKEEVQFIESMIRPTEQISD